MAKMSSVLDVKANTDIAGRPITSRPGIASIAAHQTPTPPSDGRSPDTADAALLAHSPVVTLTKPSGFAWREFGIGAAAATAAILLLLGLRAGLPAARERREIARPPASA